MSLVNETLKFLDISSDLLLPIGVSALIFIFALVLYIWWAYVQSEVKALTDMVLNSSKSYKKFDMG